MHEWLENLYIYTKESTYQGNILGKSLKNTKTFITKIANKNDQNNTVCIEEQNY